MKLRTIKAPKPQKCGECGAKTRFELSAAENALKEVEMHECTCSRSEYRKAREKCLAAGGHFPVEVSAGSHSYFECSKCGQGC